MSKGIDIRQSGSALLIRALLLDADGAKITSGTASLRLWELQSDGTLHTFDFNDNTFKSGAVTTATASLTHRQAENASYDTGVWTYAQTSVGGFTAGRIIIAEVHHEDASPPTQTREIQYGGAEGDIAVTSGRVEADMTAISGDTTAADNLEAAADGTGYNLGGGQVVAASVTGSIGSISGVTFPANFGALLINESGHLGRVTLVDTTTANTDMRGTDGALTTLGTNAPAGWINSDAVAASALNGKGDWLLSSSYTAPDNAGIAEASAQATAAASQTTATAIRGAVGLESANLDTQLSGLASGEAVDDLADAVGEIQSKTANLPDEPASKGDVQVTVEGGGGAGTGDIPVIPPAITRDGVGVDNALVRVYLASDYALGNYELRGEAVTGPDGVVVAPLMLNAGSYKAVVWDPQARRSQVFDLDVPAGGN